MRILATFLLCCCVLATGASEISARSDVALQYRKNLHKIPILAHKRLPQGQHAVVSQLVGIRGGIEKKKKEEKPSILKSVQHTLEKVKPATRAYLILSVVCTLVHLSGVVNAPALFMLDSSRAWELWRPFTASAFLGGLTMSTLTNLYFLLKYGTRLEEQSGTGEHVWFLLTQITLTSVIGWLLRFPFMATSVVAAHLYSCSRLDPYLKTSWYFGIVLDYWQLPFCLMAIECVQTQSLFAAIPHIIGILTGHIYHFGHNVWPKLGGRRLIEAPLWITKRFGGRPSSNVSGLDFRKSHKKQQSDKSQTVLSKRQRALLSKKGKKLGTNTK